MVPKYEGRSNSNLHIFGACEDGNNARKYSQPVISRLKQSCRQSFVILHCVYRELWCCKHDTTRRSVVQIRTPRRYPLPHFTW